MQSLLMQFVPAAILAVFGGLGQDSADQDASTWRTPPRPVRIQVVLVDERVLKGHLDRFDQDRFAGSFGTVEWDEVPWRERESLFRRLMDSDSAHDWVMLGSLLCHQIPAEDRAEAAFARAIKMDPSVQLLVQQALEAGLQKRQEIARAAEEDQRTRLRRLDPESGPWPKDPWPVLDPLQQKAAIESLLQQADSMQSDAGIAWVPIQTEHFIIYSDLPASELVRARQVLEESYVGMQNLLGLPDQQGVFWGKAVVFIHGRQDVLRLLVAAAFNQGLDRDVTGTCHYHGQRAFINVLSTPDAARSEAVLAHQAAHAFMHCHISPRRLPAWVNEGIPEYIANQVGTGAVVDADHRPLALSYLRNGGSILRVMDLRYEDGSWNDAGRIAYPVGYLGTSYLASNQLSSLRRWIRLVKEGVPSGEAMKQAMGGGPDRLSAAIINHYRNNDGDR
ncbi:MAG: hypothetical protein CMJ32_02125 [Phycisphaerae bacterium]|nr:hypothetical protein [Phycisphaerae bacterium]